MEGGDRDQDKPPFTGLHEDDKSPSASGNGVDLSSVNGNSSASGLELLIAVLTADQERTAAAEQLLALALGLGQQAPVLIPVGHDEVGVQVMEPMFEGHQVGILEPTPNQEAQPGPVQGQAEEGSEGQDKQVQVGEQPGAVQGQHEGAREDAKED